MKILVLNNDVMERTIIQQVLQHNKHEIIPSRDSKAAMQLLQEGDIRFVIADRGTTDIDEAQFIKHLRELQPPYYIYILLIASKVSETDVTTPRTGADEYLHKPIIPLELKSRVHIGERILGLGVRERAREALFFTGFAPVCHRLFTAIHRYFTAFHRPVRRFRVGAGASGCRKRNRNRRLRRHRRTP